MNKMTSKRQHSLYTGLVLTLLLLVLTACGKETTNGSEASKTPAPISTVQPSTAPSVVPSSTPTAAPTATPKADEQAVKKGTGTYVGQADPHTVEITVNQNATAFQLDENTMDQVKTLKQNDAVQFEYTEKAVPGDNKVKQLTLTKISKK
ncbi:hypothetical protein D3C73_746500 [compost metagenome]